MVMRNIMEQERHAKLGKVKYHTSMQTMLPISQLSDLKATYAETQTTVTPSGATLLTPIRDGSTVIQSTLKEQQNQL